MIQPTCPWCEMGFYRESWHVEGFQETGRCGSKWFPDFEGGHVDGRKQSEACKEISALRAQITEMQSNASTAAFEKVNDQLAEANRENAELRAQVATLSAGKAWIPDPTLADLDGELSRVWPVADGWRKGFLACMCWAREHAVAPVVVPELTSQWCDEIWRNAPRGVPVWDALKWVIEQDRARLRPIPADRILQDGERAVDSRRFDRMLADESERPYLLELEQYVRTMARLQNWSRDTTGHGPLNRLDALRAKKEGGQE